MGCKYLVLASTGICLLCVLLGFLLQLQAPDALQVSADGVDGADVVVPEGGRDLGHGPLLIINLPRHTEALSIYTNQIRDGHMVRAQPDMSPRESD